MKSKTKKKLRELQRRIEAVESRLPAQEGGAPPKPDDALRAVTPAKGSSQA